MSKINLFLLALLITIFSFVVRVFYNGASSFSLDEMISIYLAKSPLFDSLYFNHPPLYFQILKIWSALVPQTEPFYRILGGIFSTLATVGMGFIGYRLYSPISGLMLMMFHSVAPLSILHSQLLLNYSLFELLSVVQVYFYITFVKTSKNRNLLLGTSFLLVMTNYFGFLLLFTQWLVLQKSKIRFDKAFLVFIILIVSLPLALDIIDVKALVWQKIEYHANDFSFLPTNLFRIFLFVSPLSSFAILILTFYYLYRHFDKYKNFIQVFVGVLTLFVIFSSYTKRFVFAVRYFIFALPFFLIFLERMIHQLAIQEKRKILAGFSAAAIITGGLYEYQFYIPVKTSNWAQAAVTVGDQERTLIVTSIADYIKHPYFSHLSPGVVRCVSLAEFINVIVSHQGPIWVMDTYINFLGYQDGLFKALTAQNYKLIDFSIQAPNVDPVILFKVQKN